MLAYNLIQTAYDHEKRKAMFLLMREIPEFGNSTCLQLAKLASNLNFLGHKCVQELLVNLWYDKLSSDTPYYCIGVCLFIPLLAPFLCTYREMKTLEEVETANKEYASVVYNDIKGCKDDPKPNLRNKNKINLNMLQRRYNYIEKIYYFLDAPLVKFFYDKVTIPKIIYFHRLTE